MIHININNYNYISFIPMDKLASISFWTKKTRFINADNADNALITDPPIKYDEFKPQLIEYDEIRAPMQLFCGEVRTLQYYENRIMELFPSFTKRKMTHTEACIFLKSLAREVLLNTKLSGEAWGYIYATERIYNRTHFFKFKRPELNILEPKRIYS
jgi:hypothetical protein